ncbi:MAG: bifunctional sulfur carrier protein/thiazole synthase protein [Firmicutes bacterium]|nr:bifunctional sulfur carrier protein/thiazole synthase protein [Bacillota bacterium]
MQLIVNGKKVEAADGITISQLVAEKGLNSESVVVEHNSVILCRADWGTKMLGQGDQVEIVTFVGGG